MKDSSFIVPIRHYRIHRSAFIDLEVEMPSKSEAEALASIRPRPSYQHLLWGAGGGTYFLGERYAVMVRRSLDAPTNPGRWTFATGLGSTYEELNDPRLFIRELFEEIVLKTKDEELLIPRMTGDSSFLNARIEQWIVQACKSSGISYEEKKYVPAELVKAIGQDTITVINGNERVSTQALLHVDEQRGSVNLLSAVRLKGIHGIEGLTAYDTELGPNLRPLHRQTAWCDIQSGKILFPEHDAWIEMDGNITPHAAHLLASLQTLLEENE